MEASGMNGKQSCYVKQSEPEACNVREAEDLSSETDGPFCNQNGQKIPFLSQCSDIAFSSDSGLSFTEPGQNSENSDSNQPDPCEWEHGPHEDAHSANGFSEGHLLNIMFEACDTSGKGEVLVSRVMQYLQDMTAQTPDQGKLTALYNMLDPERQDRALTREVFHSTMRMWIAQCCQTRGEQMDHHLSTEKNFHPTEDYFSTPESLLNTGNGFFPLWTESDTEATADSQASSKLEFPEGADGCYCDWKDLVSTVAELRHTHRQLSEQNENLLRSMVQCEDTNLQLTLEITELKAKLVSVQRAAVRARSLLEELDEARRALKECQERWAQAQTRACTLTKENENLKAHIKLIEDANEKLSQERTFAEGRVSKLMKMNSEIREELDETLVSMSEKDNNISKKTTFINELKVSHLENLRIIEGLQLELMRLQENSQQELLRFDRCTAGTQSPLTGCHPLPQNPSLQAEIQETQERENLEGANSPMCGILPQNMQKEDFQRVIHKIKSWEIVPLFHRSHSEVDSYVGNAVHVLERAFLQTHQHQASTKQQLSKVESDLALQKALREDMEKREEEAQRQTQEAKKMATVSWWRALKMEEDRNMARKQVSLATHACDETKEKLRSAEATIGELQDQVRHLQAALSINPQQCRSSGEQRDAAVGTDPEEEAGGFVVAGPSCGQVLNVDRVTEVWRRVEMTASRAAEAAGLLHLSEGWIHQARQRVKAATERVEKALSRAVNAEADLNQLKDKISKRLESTGPVQSSDLGTVGVASFGNSCSESDSSPTALESVSQTLQVPPCHLPHIPPGVSISLAKGGCDSCAKDNNTFGTASFIDTPTQAQVTPVSSNSLPTSSDNDCAGPQDLAQARTQTAVLESCVSGSTSAPGPPHLETCPAPKQENAPESCNTEQTLGLTDVRSDTPACHESCQYEPVDNGGSQAEVNENLASTAVLTAEEDPILLHSFLRERDQSIQAAISSTSPVPHIVTKATSILRRAPTMPTLPEEEEDSPEDIDSTNSSPVTCTPVGKKVLTMPLPPPSIVLPRKDDYGHQDSKPFEQARPISPRPRLSRNTSSGCPITTVDSTGHVIDLVKDPLPDLKLSAEDKQKNLELLEEAKRVSDRFLSRRGRRSTSSLSESPTGGLSPNLTPMSSPAPSRSSSLTVPPQTTGFSPISTPHPSPVSSRSNSLTVPPQNALEELGANYVSTPPIQRMEVRLSVQQEDKSLLDQESLKKLVDFKTIEKRKVSSGTLSPRCTVATATNEDSGKLREKGKWGLEARQAEECPGRGTQKRVPDDEAPATGVAKPVPRPASQQAPCTAEIRTIGAFPPLMRAVSWDTVGSFPARNGAQGASPNDEEADSLFDKSSESLFKSLGYKDFPVQPVNMQKLSKLREEHKLMRNQTIVGSKLPDLSETAEQERGPSPCPTLESPTEEEAKEKSDALAHGLRGYDNSKGSLVVEAPSKKSSPPLTEKEVENVFVQLSLAFRNDNYTLETRLRQAERERNLTEENTEKELEEFKGFLKGSASLWQTLDQRESYQRLLETIAVLHRLATRLSSRAELVGAVRQEKRMNKATEVMMQYVENLKRTYEKDHAELMEFKKLANQNSNRCYGGSIDTGDDGVPRTSRSMSVTLGKALPRRRVSVAVVPKFNLLNIPGQTPPNASGPLLPVLCEANSAKGSPPTEPAQQPPPENVKSLADQESETSTAKPPCGPAEISSDVKAKIEEEAYNKGYQEGLKRCKELQELKEAEEKMEETQEETEDKEKERERDKAEEKTRSSKYEKVLEVFDWLCPKLLGNQRLLWIVMTLFMAMFLLVSMFTYFGDCSNAVGDVSAGKAMGPGKKKFFGWNMRLQPKNPIPE